jgi:hypothetical protein
VVQDLKRNCREVSLSVVMVKGKIEKMAKGATAAAVQG